MREYFAFACAISLKFFHIYEDIYMIMYVNMFCIFTFMLDAEDNMHVCTCMMPGMHIYIAQVPVLNLADEHVCTCMMHVCTCMMRVVCISILHKCQF
jgi:hypothetical protein